MSDDLLTADSRYIAEPMANMLLEHGPHATFKWLTTLLEKQSQTLSSSNSHLVAYTGEPEALNWLENNVNTPVSTHWGEAAALLDISWQQIKGWLESNRHKQLMALDAIYACRLPAPNMSPLAQIAAPVLSDAPTKEEFESVLNLIVENGGTARIRQTVERIMVHLAGILTPRERGVSVSELPQLFIDPEKFPNADTILNQHETVVTSMRESLQDIVNNDRE